MVEKWCRSVSYTRKRLSLTGNVFSSHSDAIPLIYSLDVSVLSAICSRRRRWPPKQGFLPYSGYGYLE